MRIWAMVSALVGLVLLGGCTSGGGGGSSVFRGEALHAPAGVPAQQRTAAGGGTAGSADSADSASASSAKETVLIAGRALIRTADLRVAVKKGTVGTQASRAEDIALGYGGEVFSDDRTSGDAATAALTLKVPPDSLEEVLGRLAALGAEKSRSLSTQDVTERVADVQSRVQSARDSIARLRTLYDSATKVSDVISIESELASRESDLESLEAQQRALDAQTSMATVHLDLETAVPAPAPPAKPHHEHGIGGALATGWHGFTAAAAWIARALATALPFAVLLALVVLVARRFAWRRRPAG